MFFAKQSFLSLGAGALGLCAFAGAAHAVDFSNAATYNAPFAMQPGQENQMIDPSLRDQNGNLTLVNGQFQSSQFSQGFSQSGAVAPTSAQPQTFGSGGAGQSGSGAAFGGATAIGNALNVITTGNNNTVVVDSRQTNNGSVTATTTVNAHQ